MADLRVMSFGAGVQSTTLGKMITHGELPPVDCGIFSDTGWEPRHVYEHLHWLTGCELVTTPDGRVTVKPGTYQNAELSFPIHIVSAGDIYTDVIRSVEEGEARVGQPPFYTKSPVDASKGILLRKCTTEYKIEPINRKIRELLGVGPGQRVPKGVLVEQWFGISLDEVQRMKVARDKWIRNRYPLVEDANPPMDRQACLSWMERHGYPEPPKSSCIGCPFHSDAMWRDMKDNHPDEWAQAVRWDEVIRRGLPGVSSEAYVHKSLIPLKDADLRTVHEKGQMTLWDDFINECEGMCGV